MAEMPEATTAPDALCCPISMEIMRDPVIAADGHTYERADIELWFANNNTSPKTGAVLPHVSLIPNHALKAMISDFLDEALSAAHEEGEAVVPAAREEEGDAAAADDEDDEDDEDEEDDGALQSLSPPDNASPRAPERRRSGGPAAVAEEGDSGARTTSSRFWGVNWHRRDKKWRAKYTDANGKLRHIGYFDDEEEAARAVNKAIRDAGLVRKRRMNAVDATGTLVPKPQKTAAVPPDQARAPTATTSKFWGVTWDKRTRRWQAYYTDANSKSRKIGYYDTQEAAAHAVNAAIRRAGLEGRRKTNPVVDGQLVPKPPGPHRKKRRRDEPAAAAPSTRQRK